MRATNDFPEVPTYLPREDDTEFDRDVGETEVDRRRAGTRYSSS